MDKIATRLDFRPFRAWRYQADRVELDRVIAPPYDVISPAEREVLYAKSPFNVVRLILGKESNFYEHAAKSWREWAEKGILGQDPSPAIYLYEQSFHHPIDSRTLSRVAMVGILKLDPSGGVLRHETTFDAPKKDRFLLLEKTKTNLSPVFGLYQDSTRLGGLFSSCRQRPPFFQARDDQGVLHRGWAVQKEEEQRIIREALADEKILIADGHHRYETALEYQRQMREKFSGLAGEADFDFVMMALVASDDQGLVVLPTHRIIRLLDSCSEKEFIERLSEFFDLQPCKEDILFATLEKSLQTETVFAGIFRTSGSYLFRTKNSNAARSLLPGKPPLWYEVGANLLNHLVFEKLWGFPIEKRPAVVEYTHSADEALQAVRQRRAEAAFLLRTPKVDTIRKLAYAGEQMPQKTTYFYPKLASGVFFYRHR